MYSLDFTRFLENDPLRIDVLLFNQMYEVDFVNTCIGIGKDLFNALV